MQKQIAANTKYDAVLVSMPFGPIDAPSLALGLLKAVAAEAGFRVSVAYGNVRFADVLGQGLYNWLSLGGPTPTALAAEWIFSGCLNEQSQDEIESYLNEIIYPLLADDPRDGQPYKKETMIENLLRARSMASGFIEEEAQRVVELNARLVGITSVFQQNTASLTLARRIKAIDPSKFVVMGGANCQGDMGRELFYRYPFLDAVVSGEGEDPFISLLDHLSSRKTPLLHPAILHRNFRVATAGKTLSIVAHPVSLKRASKDSLHTRSTEQETTSARYKDLNLLPLPDFREYFAAISALSSPPLRPPQIIMETSRGCWWGAIKHCTFCGLDDASIAFRAKGQVRALNEFVSLTTMYEAKTVFMADDIMDLKYFDEFVPGLIKANLDVDVFFEMKSNITREQVRMLHQAKIRKIQPGIESLSDELLLLMGKGVRAIHNIQLLKWCKELGVRVYWNVLWGFPGERFEAYQEMESLVECLTHLPPPAGAGPIRLDRFSPNYEKAEEFGLINVRPYPAYRYVYKLGPEALSHLAYCFEYDYADERDVSEYTSSLGDALTSWQLNHEASELLLLKLDHQILILDTRPCAVSLATILRGVDMRIYLACLTKIDIHELLRLMREAIGEIRLEDLQTSLDALISRKLIIKIGNAYLSLAFSTDEYRPRGMGLDSILRGLQNIGVRIDRQDAIIDIERFAIGPRAAQCDEYSPICTGDLLPFFSLGNG